jgi:hypothetical protein
MYTALRKEQLRNSNTRSTTQGIRAVRHQDWKQKCPGQHNVEMPFLRMITDVTGIPLGEEGMVICL